MNVIRQILRTIICMLLISGTVMHKMSNKKKNKTYKKKVQNTSIIRTTTSTKTSKKLSERGISLQILSVPLFLILLYAIHTCYRYCRGMRFREAAMLHLITKNRQQANEYQQQENQQDENQQDENQQDENQQDENQQNENQQHEFLPDHFAMLPPGNIENYDDIFNNAAIDG
ncbi:uncharacterized protein [Linepithema humile]